MPMPASEMVSVRASLSGTMRILASAGSAERRVGQRLEAAAVDGVGGVGDEFAEEDLAVGVERMDDEIEQSPDLGAEFMAFGGASFAHLGPPSFGGGGYAFELGWISTYSAAERAFAGVLSAGMARLARKARTPAISTPMTLPFSSKSRVRPGATSSLALLVGGAFGGEVDTDCVGFGVEGRAGFHGVKCITPGRALGS